MRAIHRKRFLLLGLALVQFHSLSGQSVDSSILSGGQTTVVQSGQNAFSLPLANISRAHRREHVVGNSFFNRNWIAAPGSPKARDGLGPLFNARSCSACHLRDGRGSPFDQEGRLQSLILRLSIPGRDNHGGPLPAPSLGHQLGTRSLPGVASEGQVRTQVRTRRGHFGDGTPFTLEHSEFDLLPTIEIRDGSPELQISPRLAPPVFGLGLIEAIAADDIESFADPLDLDGDGISGKPNRVWNPESKRHELGRFGWKANQATLRQQIAAAFLNDIGMTSTLHPDEALSPEQLNQYGSLPNGGTPEITDQILNRVVLYQQTLAPPGRRNLDDEDVLLGEKQFEAFSCHRCHRQTFTTGRHPEVDELSRQSIAPFTDLLLHDMGPDLADGRSDYQASGSEWRTPPLWGIGLTATVNRNEFYLHDGRARTLTEAILWHGGEAAHSREAFRQASKKERGQLLAFLKSL